MTCADCRDLLPLHLYGDSSDADRRLADAHLSGCAACRAELAALARTRGALDAAPVPPVAVDLNRIFRSEAERQRRAARRWRAAALVGIAAAALVVVLRLDIRADARQVTVRWGSPAPVEPPPRVPPAVIVQTQQVVSPELEERLAVLTELIHALAANVETGDRERAADLGRLRSEMAGLRRQGDQRWTETERSVSALYAAQFGPRTQGDKP
jgi:hypothetical protein